MLNINTRIIILAIIVLLLVGAASLLYLKVGKNIVNNNVGPVNSLPINKQSNTEPDIKALENNIAKNLPLLKQSHPEFSTFQLEFYSQTAKAENMSPCLGKNDEVACISAVAFLINNYNFCGEISDAQKIECANSILGTEAPTEIAKCNFVTNEDFKTQCLVNIFIVYNQPADCAAFTDLAIKNTCESVAYYQMALLQANNTLCANIKDEYLKNYCTKNIK